MKLIALGLIVLGSMLTAVTAIAAQEPKTPAELHKLAQDYYTWRNQNYPVASERRWTAHLGRQANELFPLGNSLPLAQFTADRE